MKLLFLRHGQAGHNANDDIRELTEKGRHDVKHVAKARRESLARVEQVLVSPIVRAQQTADIACEVAGIAAPRYTVDWLIHETPVREALAAMAALDRRTLLVGHQPLASQLIESLCGLDRGMIDVGTADLIEMKGDAFISGAMHITHHERP